jgi:hypothetical protein
MVAHYRLKRATAPSPARYAVGLSPGGGEARSTAPFSLSEGWVCSLSL